MCAFVCLSLSSQADQPADDAPAAAVVHSAEYLALHRDRELIKNIKSTVSSAARSFGNSTKAYEFTKPMDAVEGAAAERIRRKADEDLKIQLAQLQQLGVDYEEMKAGDSSNDDAVDVLKIIAEVIRLCSSVPESKVEYGHFVMTIQALTAQLFKEQTRLLQCMKDAKLKQADSSKQQ